MNDECFNSLFQLLFYNHQSPKMCCKVKIYLKMWMMKWIKKGQKDKVYNKKVKYDNGLEMACHIYYKAILIWSGENSWLNFYKNSSKIAEIAF